MPLKKDARVTRLATLRKLLELPHYAHLIRGPKHALIVLDERQYAKDLSDEEMLRLGALIAVLSERGNTVLITQDEGVLQLARLYQFVGLDR